MISCMTLQVLAIFPTENSVGPVCWKSSMDDRTLKWSYGSSRIHWLPVPCVLSIYYNSFLCCWVVPVCIKSVT